MGGLILAPAIGAAGSIAQGLIGKHAQNNALKAQQEATNKSLALQQQQLDDERKVNQYGMQQAHALQARNMQMANANLRRFGVTGLQDPNVDWQTINQAPPTLVPQLNRPPQYPVRSIYNQPPQPAGMTLGQMFAPSQTGPRY